MSANKSILTPKIGSFVLETLTTGMYTNPLDTLREYVQNSFDAIREAERTEIIPKGAGRIEIIISEKDQSLTIRDNGTGIPLNEINSRLINIGISSKSINIDAGFRGIGRLAGIAYCDKLIFKTQSNGELDISTVTFLCDKLRESMMPSKIQTAELAEIISDYTLVTTEKAHKREHFFEVKMEGINPSGEIFLELKKIHAYLSQVAPVGFDMQSFLFAGTIHEWLKDHKIDIPTVSIIIRSGLTNYQVFKPYRKLTYTTTNKKYKVHLKNIRFFPEDANPNSQYWLWYAETNCPGIIGDGTVAGFRLRKTNIGIGMAERMTEIFAEASESYARFNKYFIGEIHIQDPHVIPNARRDDFEDSSEWIKIRKSLIEFARERSREAYRLSEARNLDIDRLLSSVEKDIDKAETIIKTGLSSKEEKNNILGKLDKQINKLEESLKVDRTEEERTKIQDTHARLQKTRDNIENETKFITKKLNPALDNKQRKIISEILEILYKMLDEKTFEKVRDAIMAKYHVSDKEKKR